MTSVLRDLSAQALNSVNIKISQTLFQHHMQTIRRVVLAPFLRQLDEIIRKSAPCSLGFNLFETYEITRRRLHPPRRMCGGACAAAPSGARSTCPPRLTSEEEPLSRSAGCPTAPTPTA